MGRVVRRDLALIIERDRPGPGHAYSWQPDPDLSAGDGPPCPVGWAPLAVVDGTYAELLGLEPATNSEASTAEARSVAAVYDRPTAGSGHYRGVSTRRWALSALLQGLLRPVSSLKAI